MNVLDQNHTKITLGLTISMLAATVSIVWWASDINTRMKDVEETNKIQWQRISAFSAIGDKVARIDERTETIMEMLRE